MLLSILSTLFADLPKVELTKVDVTETEIQVQWTFDSDGRSKRTAEERIYHVLVQIKYKKESDKEYLTHPEDGSKIPADWVMIYLKHLLAVA